MRYAIVQPYLIVYVSHQRHGSPDIRILPGHLHAALCTRQRDKLGRARNGPAAAALRTPQTPHHIVPLLVPAKRTLTVKVIVRLERGSPLRGHLHGIAVADADVVDAGDIFERSDHNDAPVADHVVRVGFARVVEPGGAEGQRRAHSVGKRPVVEGHGVDDQFTVRILDDVLARRHVFFPEERHDFLDNVREGGDLKHWRFDLKKICSKIHHTLCTERNQFLM